MTENSIFKAIVKTAIIVAGESYRKNKDWKDPSVLMLAGASAAAFYIAPNVAGMIIKEVIGSAPTNLENQLIEIASSASLVVGYDTLFLKEPISYSAFRNIDTSNDTVMKLGEHVVAHFAGEMLESYIETTFPAIKTTPVIQYLF